MRDNIFVNINVKDNIFADIKILKASFVSLEDRIAKIEGASKKSFATLKNQVDKIELSSVIQNFTNLSDALGSMSAPGLKFNASMTELQAMSGLTGKELKNLGDMARENAKVFGGDAAKSVETYKLLIAQLGPEIAKQPKVLNDMAKNAEILAKSMGGDVVGAAGVLSTAMHQYNVDLSDAKGAQEEMTKMMNAMSASANAGASELPQLKEAVGVAGATAKTAGLEFEQMLTAIQVLDKANYKASEGGTALRAVLMRLSKEDFLPPSTAKRLADAEIDIHKLADTTVSFTDKMRMLKPIANETALLGALFGEPYAGAAQALINTADAQDEMTESIKGTTEAEYYAKTMMESKEEKLARMKAAIDDYKVSMFELTGGITAYMQPASEMIRDITSLSPLLSMAKGGLSLFKKETYANIAATKTWQFVTKTATVVTKLFNAALKANPIGLIIGLAAAAGTAIYGLAKAFQHSTLAQQANADVTKRVNEAMVSERVELDMLFKQLKNTNPGTEERKKLVSELTNKYPDLLKGYDLEIMKAQELDQVQQMLIKNIRNRIKAEVKQDKAKELLKEAEEAKGKSPFALNVWSNKQKYEYIKELEDVAEKLIGESVELQTSKSKNQEKTTNDNVTPEDDNPVVIPGLTPPPPKDEKSDKSSSSGTSTTVDKRSISVKIDRLVENINISTTNIKESASEIKKQVTEAMIGAVRDFEIAI